MRQPSDLDAAFGRLVTVTRVYDCDLLVDLAIERLEKLLVSDDTRLSPAVRQRLKWARAALRGVRTSFARLSVAFHPVESAAKQARHQKSLEWLRQRREEKRGNSEVAPVGSAISARVAREAVES